MNYLKLFLLVLILSIFISDKYTIVGKNSPINKKVIGKGIVAFMVPASTREIHNHNGYILKESEWIIPPAEERLFTFLKPDSLIKSFENKRVYVEGQQYKISPKKINSYTFINPYNVIAVDTIYIIH